MLILFVRRIIDSGTLAVATSVDHVRLLARLSVVSLNWQIYFLVVRIPVIIDSVFLGALTIDGGNASGPNISSLTI